MPAAVGSKPAPPRHDDIDNYDIGDLSDDPFRSPSPDRSSSKKRKDPPTQSGLGIDEEVSVQKRARVPNIKLDEERLLGPAGIPKLRSRAARGLHLKGKGHEFGDAARLLSFYQLWLDDLFPKARFLDALSMVEKAGHKKKLALARMDWINEGKSKGREEDEEDQDLEMRPISTLEKAPERPSTPPLGTSGGDVPDDNDLYDATPRRAPPTVAVLNDEPDPDDLEALMAEAAGQDTARPPNPPATDEPEEDDLEALIAEAESRDRGPGKDGGLAKPQTQGPADDFAEDEAAMQEMDGLW